MNVLKVPPAASFATWGAGAVGLSALLAAKFCGAATLIAVDIDESRLALARDLGATHTVNSKNEDAVAAVKAITHGGVDFALESQAGRTCCNTVWMPWAHWAKSPWWAHRPWAPPPNLM